MDQDAETAPPEDSEPPASAHRPVVELHNPFEQFDFEPPYGGDF